MKIHRFIGDFDLNQKNIIVTDKTLIHQISRVLKLELGEKIALSNGDGLENIYTIKDINKNEVTLETNAKPITTPKTKVEVTLFMAILKKENFETVVEKATELGVKEIVPIITARTIKQNINIDRLQKIALEASELSGRGEVPKINEVANFDDILKRRGEFNEGWIMERGEEKNKESDSVKTRAIIVGPEGGFTKEEIEKALSNGFEPVSLSPLTFRGETAGIIGTYIATQ